MFDSEPQSQPCPSCGYPSHAGHSSACQKKSSSEKHPEVQFFGSDALGTVADEQKKQQEVDRLAKQSVSELMVDFDYAQRSGKVDTIMQAIEIARKREGITDEKFKEMQEDSGISLRSA